MRVRSRMTKPIIILLLALAIPINVYAQVYNEQVICGGGWCEGDTVYQNKNKAWNECHEVPVKADKVTCRQLGDCKKYCTLKFGKGGSCGYCADEEDL